MSSNSYEQYTQVSYSGRALLAKHKLDESGMWRIRGEDPNCDFGGHHYQPELGIVEGRLEDVIKYAVTLKSFWTWGGGGNIEKIGPIPKITAESNAKRVALEQQLELLKNQVAAVENQLKSI
jgi:hypothetical protein